MSKRVLVVTTWLPTGVNPGSGSFVARDIAALAQDYDVRVLHLVASRDDDGTRWGTIGGVRVVRQVMDVNNPLHILRAHRAIRRYAAQADLVHTMAVSALLPLVLHGPGRPWVHTEHWSGVNQIAQDSGLVSAVLSGGMKLLYTGPDVVVSVSNYLNDGVAQARRGPTAVVGNIVDSSRLRVRRQIRDKEVRLIGIGALTEHKGPLVAVQAVAELKRRGWDASLVWLGEGPQRAEVEALIESSGVNVVLAGQVPKGEVNDLICKADILLHPSVSETFSMAAAEALVLGRPVVIGSRGGQTDFVRPPAGVLVEQRTAAAYADGVEEAVAQCEGLRAKEIADPVRQAYSQQAYLEKYGHIYALVSGS